MLGPRYFIIVQHAVAGWPLYLYPYPRGQDDQISYDMEYGRRLVDNAPRWALTRRT